VDHIFIGLNVYSLEFVEALYMKQWYIAIAVAIVYIWLLALHFMHGRGHGLFGLSMLYIDCGIIKRAKKTDKFKE